jgi:hypothetical protein
MNNRTVFSIISRHGICGVALGLALVAGLPLVGCTQRHGPRVWISSQATEAYALPSVDTPTHSAFRGTPVYVMHSHDNAAPSAADLRLVTLVQQEMHAAGFAVADTFEESGIVFTCQQASKLVVAAAAEPAQATQTGKSDRGTARPPVCPRRRIGGDGRTRPSDRQTRASAQVGGGARHVRRDDDHREGDADGAGSRPRFHTGLDGRDGGFALVVRGAPGGGCPHAAEEAGPQRLGRGLPPGPVGGGS